MPKDFIFGKNAVLEALKAHSPLNKIFLEGSATKSAFSAIVALAKEQGVPCVSVPPAKIRALLPDVQTQGVVASCAPFAYAELDDLLTAPSPLILILDGIVDPHNLGALLRTADAVGAGGVIIPKRRAAPMTGVVYKTSAGAGAYVPVHRADNLVRTMKALKDRGLWIAGADMAGDKLYFEADLTGPIALVIGSEGKGISRLVRETCDFLVRLPMSGSINSLNASVAGSVLLYEIFRQRQMGEQNEP